MLFWLEPTRKLSFLGLMLIGAAFAAVGIVAKAAGLATIGASVVVLTLALLVLYRVVVWRGRAGEGAAGLG